MLLPVKLKLDLEHIDIFGTLGLLTIYLLNQLTTVIDRKSVV